jgi:hypothetical protein
MPDEIVDQPVKSDASAMRDLMEEQDPAPKIEESPAPVSKTPSETPTAETPAPESSLKTPDTPPEGAPEQDDFLKDLEGRKLRPQAHASTSEQFEHVKSKAREEHQARIELEARFKALEAEKGTIEPITPELKEKLSKLEDFYNNYGITEDPSFNEEYNSRMQQGEEQAIATVNSRRAILPESSSKYIMSNGGPSVFRYSQNLMPAQFKNQDGSPMTHQGYWDRYVAPNLDPDQKEELDDIFRGIRDVKREKTSKEQDVKQNREQYVQQTRSKAEQQQKDWIAAATSHAEKYVESLGDIARIKEIPADATPETRSSLEKHNARVAKARGIAENISKTILQSPQTFSESVLDAARSKVMDEIVAEKDEAVVAKDKIINDLRKELEAIKKSSSLARKTVQPNLNKPKAPTKGQTAGEIMSGYMQEAGELPRR